MTKTKTNIMKRNTIEQMNQFKVNQKVNIYDSITGELDYSGTIINIEKKAWSKNNEPRRCAVILDSNGNKRLNLLASAK